MNSILKKSLQTVISIAVCMTFFSCQNQYEPIKKGLNLGEPIELYISGIETRTTEGDINQGSVSMKSSIGVFAKATKWEIQNGENKAYVVGTEGKLNPKDETPLMAKENDEVNFYAYAPYNENWTTLDNPCEFKVKEDQSDPSGYLASDLLFAKQTIEKVGKSTNTVGLTFSHQLSRIELQIDNTEKQEDLNDATVIINNTKIGATFNLSTGLIEVSDKESSDIILSKDVGEASVLYAVVVPQTINSGTKLFTIDIGEKEFTATLGSNMKFESGKSYTFTINLKSQDVTLTLGDLKVNDWTTGTGGDLTITEVTKEESYETFDIEWNNISIVQPNNYKSGDWKEDIKTFRWWNYGNNQPAKLYLVTNELTMKESEFDKYNSLVFEISEFLNNYNSDIYNDSYLVVCNEEGVEFNVLENEIFKIIKKGTIALDLRNYDNQNLFEETKDIYLIAKEPGPATSGSPYHAAFERIYFTTQPAETINQ